MEVIKLRVAELTPYKNNAKEHPREQIEQIKNSIKKFGNNDPIAVWGENNIIVEGHGRLLALKELGYEEVECIRLDHLNDEERRAYTLAHNQLTMNTGWDVELLNMELGELEELDVDMTEFGFELEEPDQHETAKVENGKLTDEFIVPPLSVFDTKQGYWRDRKRMWKDLGIKSENGRDAECLSTSIGEKYGRKETTGVSIFDPVLCEIAYKWFNIEGGKIYDCFAGGSVRGIVASMLGYDYTGIDLRQEQVDANYENASEMGVQVKWYCDDSLNADLYVEDNSVDMIFSCPPYADLEVYSDDERDISNMEYDQFKEVYRRIIDIACRKLKENRFAVFVVGDIRDKEGYYRNFVDYTKECFNANGLLTYNEIILLDCLGTSMIRCKRPFNKSRKVAKVHQNVLVFYKGDINKINDNYHEINVEDFSPETIDIY